MRWREEINLIGVLAWGDNNFDLSRVEEPCPEELKNRIAAELQKSDWLLRFAFEILSQTSIAGVDRVLERVYDAADKHRVWCGMPGVSN